MVKGPGNVLFCFSYPVERISQHEGRADLPREEIGPYGKGSNCFSIGTVVPSSILKTIATCDFLGGPDPLSPAMYSPLLAYLPFNTEATGQGQIDKFLNRAVLLTVIKRTDKFGTKVV